MIDRKIHGKSRYCALDLATGLPTLTNTAMAAAASREALQMAGMQAQDIDLVIYSSVTPDYPIPPAFTILQEHLGVKSWMGFDIRSGCAGFGTAMVVGTQFLATGMAKTALIVGSDLMSSRYKPYFTSDLSKFPLKPLFNMMFFGDAAGAVVLDANGGPEGGIFGTTMGSNRATVPFGLLIPIGGSAHPYPTEAVPEDDWAITQDGTLTEATVPEVAADAIEGFLQKHQLALGDFACVVMPVVNETMRAYLQKRLPDLTDDRVVSIGPEGGALINAAVPLSLEKAFAEGRLRRGDKVLLYAAENTRWQHAVIGLVWER